MNNKTAFVLASAGLVAAAGWADRGVAQAPSESWPHEAVLEQEHPELYDLLVRIERAHGVALGALYDEGATVRASGEDIPTFGFEFDVVARLTDLVSQEGRIDEVAEEADAGYAKLGERAAEVIARTNRFHREALGILVDPSLTDRPARVAALGEAVKRYRARPEAAMPPQPKDMDILYDHPYAQDFRTGYLDLAGFIWAGFWLKVAVTEPLTDYPAGPGRVEVLDTVMTRYFAKLSYGEPPSFFPSELPQTPPIAPGIIFMEAQVPTIWDNLSFLEEVMADILATPDQVDVTAALAEATEQFVDPDFRPTTEDDWVLMALRHGIFFQGGYPIAVMEESELNVGGHAAHIAAGGSIGSFGM